MFSIFLKRGKMDFYAFIYTLAHFFLFILSNNELSVSPAHLLVESFVCKVQFDFIYTAPNQNNSSLNVIYIVKSPQDELRVCTIAKYEINEDNAELPIMQSYSTRSKKKSIELAVTVMGPLKISMQQRPQL